MIYAEYLINFSFTFSALCLMEVMGRLIFRLPMRIYSMFIGAVVLGFTLTISSHIEMSVGRHIALISAGVISWVFLEKIFIPRGYHARYKETRDVKENEGED